MTAKQGKILSGYETTSAPGASQGESKASVSQLTQWPCQIKLVPVSAPCFKGAELLIAADCTAYAYSNFHDDFMDGRITLIGCPKLDAVDYSEPSDSLTPADNEPKSRNDNSEELYSEEFYSLGPWRMPRGD